MPVSNDPKSPRVSRAAQRARELAGETTPPRASSTATTTAAVPDEFLGILSATALEDLDNLWHLHQSAKIVDKLSAIAAPLVDKSFEGLDAPALEQLAARLYVLEQRLTTVINRVSASNAKNVTKRALDTQRQLAQIQTAVFRAAVQLVDSKSTAPVGPWIVHRNTMKEPGFHTPDAQEAYYLEKLQAFIAAGGDPEQIKPVDPSFLASLKDGQLVEYAVDAFDVPRAAPSIKGKPDPGHTLLTKGGEALSAGSFVVNKDKKGNITQVVIGTFSGHFRSGLEAQHHLVRHLVAAGVPLEKIVQREGQATNPRTRELLGRLIGVDGAEAQRRESAMIADAYRWDPYAVPLPPEEKKRHGIRERSEGYNKYALSTTTMEMRTIVAKAIADGVILSEQPTSGGKSELTRLVDSIDMVLRASENAGNTLTYAQALALLKHLSKLPAVHIDEESRRMLTTLLERWQNHQLGEGVFDPADVFSRPPLRDRRARIVATINPRATEAQLKDMINAGMDIARFNTAHGTIEEQVALMKRIRAAAASLGRPISIQIDLEGPKIRLGKFENPQNLEFNDIFLTDGDTITLTTKSVMGNPKLLPVEFPTLCRDVKIGEPIYMNDGTVELRAKSIDVDAGTIEAEVVQGGKVWDRKGINLPQSDLSVRTITPEDLKNLSALLPHVDLVASSFVREPADILFLRKQMQESGRTVPIIAKIERQEGLENLEQIAIVSDALMIARGDLGVEIGYENVPAAERRINAIGKLYGKPTMVATEVLMSMVKDPSRPSRGDVEGLYAAIYDRGADAIMLGKETSFPEHPANVVEAASRVIEKAEAERRTDPFARTPDAAHGLSGPTVDAGLQATSAGALRLGGTPGAPGTPSGGRGGDGP